MNAIIRQIKREPIAVISLIFVGLAFLYEREFFQQIITNHPKIISYHRENTNGRCPLYGFEVENVGYTTVENIRIHIEEDWITQSGQEKLLIYTFEDAFIPEGKDAIIKKRPTLNVKMEFTHSTVVIPKLQPGEYIQRLIYRERQSSLNNARDELANDPLQRTRPRITLASYNGGILSVENIGDCYSK